jgi:GNAT superfamily N-acetyltransferase
MDRPTKPVAERDPRPVSVRRFTAEDRQILPSFLQREWGSAMAARLDELVDASQLDGFVATHGGDVCGILTVREDQRGSEVVTLNAIVPRIGVGRALMDAAAELTRAWGTERMWLITTNNNIGAIAFYQRWGMDLVALHHNGVERARRLKPSIPMEADGIPIRHELEFEWRPDGSHRRTAPRSSRTPRTRSDQEIIDDRPEKPVRWSRRGRAPHLGGVEGSENWLPVRHPFSRFPG